MVAATRPFFGLFSDERKLRVLELAVSEYERDNGRLRAIRDDVLAIHTPVIRFTSGSTDPKHVPSRETWCAGCGETYPCRTVTACGNNRPEDNHGA